MKESDLYNFKHQLIDVSLVFIDRESWAWDYVLRRLKESNMRHNVSGFFWHEDIEKQCYYIYVNCRLDTIVFYRKVD